MAITKTKFINYIRCPRFVALDELKKEKLNANITIEEYKQEELEAEKKELLGNMYDEEGNDLIDVENKQLEVMMPYYKDVELFAGKKIEETFKGRTTYSKETYDQKPFETTINNIKYLCYVDIYNESDDSFNIIEVKATTTKKFLDLGKTKTIDGKKEKISIFTKDINGNLILKEETNYQFNEELNEKDYKNHKAKLYDKYNAAGHYVYDLAVQRYIIEHDSNIKNKENAKYFLAVLNSDYIHDGNRYNNDLITLIDLTTVTKDYQDKINNDLKRVEEYIKNMDGSKCPIGEFCEYKKTTKCKYADLCFALPEKYSILTYINNHHGFKDEFGNKFERYDLINDGKKSILDISDNLLQKEENKIQKDAVKNNSVYIDKEKIQEGIKEITYPIYHLDFETFPCPIPRFKGEKPYYQSVFQFSLHIEREPGICDKNKDHFEYLSKDHQDNREELVKKMCDLIDTDNPGTVMVYNQAFEKTRLKELGEIFPEYKNKLKKISNMLFDLMYLIKTNSKFYQELGFDETRSKLFNYYHKDLNGSFSIKKVLPLFTNLSYKDLEVGNGMEAVVTYASFNKLTKEQFNQKYQALIEYCKQDTYAMVEILRGLRKIIR